MIVGSFVRPLSSSSAVAASVVSEHVIEILCLWPRCRRWWREGGSLLCCSLCVLQPAIHVSKRTNCRKTIKTSNWTNSQYAVLTMTVLDFVQADFYFLEGSKPINEAFVFVQAYFISMKVLKWINAWSPYLNMGCYQREVYIKYGLMCWKRVWKV